jgi:hypothetical protein
MVLRRRLRAAVPAVLTELGGLVVTAVGLSLAGFGQAVPMAILFMAVFTVGYTTLSHGRAALAATRAARETRIELGEGTLAIQRGEQRHERRVTALPALRLALERGDVGSISYDLPAPTVPAWLSALAGPPPTDLLVESVPGVGRLFQLLQAQRAEAPGTLDTPPAPGTPPRRWSAEPSSTNRPLADRLLRGLVWVPVWIGLPFMVAGIAFVILISQGSGSTPAGAGLLVLVALPALFAVFGAAVTYAQVRAYLTRRRLVSSGHRVMAEVVAIAETNVEINDVQQWAVHYRYRVGALEYGGESPMMSHGAALHWPVGDRVAIAYDPERPETSIWLGDDLIADAG